jgi:hypothetical protein
VYHPAHEVDPALDHLGTGRHGVDDGRGVGAGRHAPALAAAEKQGLAEPFKGVTADGKIAADFFAIKPTGVSTEPVKRAADAFLAALTAAQRAETTFPLDDDEWRKWMNQSPVLLIEFDHQTPANLRQLAANPNVPNHEHIHVVARTPNGNDYGKDLLRQHYAQHRHSAAFGVPVPAGR